MVEAAVLKELITWLNSFLNFSELGVGAKVVVEKVQANSSMEHEIDFSMSAILSNCRMIVLMIPM